MSKLFFATLIGFLLLIPLTMVFVLTQERENRQDAAVQGITSSWALAQTIAGPVITVPYHHYWKDNKGDTKTTVQFALFLPAQLNISGTVEPEIRKRGIFSAVLYQADLQLTGYYETPQFQNLGILPEDMLWDDMNFSLGVSDARGISEKPLLTWSNVAAELQPGEERIFESGMHARVRLDPDPVDRIPFSLELHLRGSQQLSFVPVGSQTEVILRSAWPDPSFVGTYLPQEHRVAADGFDANWNVLDFARNYPQLQLTSAAGLVELRHRLHRSAFGVQLFQSVTTYQQTTRSLKYGILFVGLTFLVFFLYEILKALQVHPVHYLLVGAALVVFYLLLLSLSEHLGFKLSFVLSSVGVIGMITVYSFSFLRVRRASILLGLILTVLYSYLYILLQIEDYALLVGSLGVFLVLAAVMYVTRGLDWSSALRIHRAQTAPNEASETGQKAPTD